MGVREACNIWPYYLQGGGHVLSAYGSVFALCQFKTARFFLTPDGYSLSLPANVRLLCSARVTRMKRCTQLHGFALLLVAFHSQWIELAAGLQRRAMSRARAPEHVQSITSEGLANVTHKLLWRFEARQTLRTQWLGDFNSSYSEMLLKSNQGAVRFSF